MTLQTYPYDSADYLDNEEEIAMFAEEALTDLDGDVAKLFVAAIVRARGLTALAAATGLPRRSIVDALSGQDPNGLETLTAALRITSAGAATQAAE